jgi:lantibiotic transport system permease protein
MIHSFQSEWLKTRRSLAAWLVIIGSLFIPLILMVSRFIYAENLPKDSINPQFWQKMFNNCWNPMAVFLLPIGVILATSLITQLEFRNNTWKQLHTTPQYLTTIFVAKLAVIVVMMVQFLLFFNIAIYLTGIIPHLILGPTLPQQPFPFYYFLEKTSYFFIDCLPIIALQYLISLQFKNFLVPLSAGLGLQIASLIATEWKYGYTIPYTYCPLNFMALRQGLAPVFGSINIHLWAFGYFILFTIASYLLYVFQKERG